MITIHATFPDLYRQPDMIAPVCVDGQFYIVASRDNDPDNSHRIHVYRLSESEAAEVILNEAVFAEQILVVVHYRELPTYEPFSCEHACYVFYPTQYIAKEIREAEALRGFDAHNPIVLPMLY